MPTIIASEGGAGYYPENTGFAVKQSLQGRLDGIELDFHLTADNHFVVHHDYRLNKHLTRDGQGNWLTEPGPVIKSSTLEQLQLFDVGKLNPASKLAKHYPQRCSRDNEKIATYQQIAALMSDQPGAELWFEAKTNPYQTALATPAIDYVKQLVPAFLAADMVEKTVLIAFDWALLRLARAALPSLQTGFLTIHPKWMARDPEVVPVQFLDDSQVLLFDEYNPIDYSGSIPQAVKAAGGRYWSPYFKDICQADVDEAHGLGLRVSTWGADTNADIRQVLTMSVDSLTTGYVDRAFSQL